MTLLHQTGGTSSSLFPSINKSTDSCMANVPQDSVKPDKAVEAILAAVFEVVVDCSQLLMCSIQHQVLPGTCP